MPSILLQGGTVILHGKDDTVSSIRADILVKDNLIAKIEPSIAASDEYDEILDCRDKIISPGFVDTHHHMWEGPLKGICEDLTAVSYFATMFTAPFTFQPNDVFWGNLAGCLEAIDAGTTTALDFCHVNWTKEYSKQAVAGSISSGIRSIVATAPTVTLSELTPEPKFADMLPDWFFPSVEKLTTAPWFQQRNKDTRVRMGLGFDFFFMPRDTVVDVFNKARALGLDIVTAHWARFPGQQGPGLPALLKEYGLLDDRIVISHLGGASPEDARLLAEAKAFVSASPSVESTMGLGPPVCFRDDLPGMDAVCSLGVDCHHSTSGSMANEMRAALVSARGAAAVASLAKGSVPRKACRTAHDAYVMATIKGARALCMDDQVGSIEVGKKADLVVFDALSPAMTGAAQHDPVTAVVMHSHISDVETVIVDGIIRKRNGKLLPTQVVDWHEGQSDFVDTDKTVVWRDIAKNVLDVQKRFVSKLPEFNFDQLNGMVESVYGIP